MFSKILVGYDGSKGGKIALETAASIAKEYNAQITALWICEPCPHYTEFPEEPQDFEIERAAIDNYFKARSEEVKEVEKKYGVKIECRMEFGNAARTILNFAEEGKFDLIVIGHSDHSELWGRLLGDTADRICDHSKCSVLIAKELPKK
ncbi:MAG: universal stress protein [Candidatus Nanoarchaeia archaeon]